MRQELEQGGGIQRFPQQFAGQRQHLEHRAPRRQRAEAQARAVHVFQRVIQQFTTRLGQQRDGLVRRLRQPALGEQGGERRALLRRVGAQHDDRAVAAQADFLLGVLQQVLLQVVQVGCFAALWRGLCLFCQRHADGLDELLPQVGKVGQRVAQGDRAHRDGVIRQQLQHTLDALAQAGFHGGAGELFNGGHVRRFAGRMLREAVPASPRGTTGRATAAGFGPPRTDRRGRIRGRRPACD